MKKIDFNKILEENSKRRERLFATYDPIAGVGSPLERFPLEVVGGNGYYLPVSMKSDPLIGEILKAGSVKEFCDKTDADVDMDDILSYVFNVRIDHDFEFWCYTCVKIQDKATGQLIPFKLNRPQRKTIKEYEGSRLANKAGRFIILKARQWGGSTVTQMYFAWIQLRHKENWNSAIATDVDDQARHIREMYIRMAESYPKSVQSITFKGYGGSIKNKQIEERGNVIGIGSVKKPDNFRSYTYQMAHLSEVGLWQDLPKQSAEDLVQSLRAGIQRKAGTMIVLESTAKGVGNFFHREYLKAKTKTSLYIPIFIPWFEIEIYQEAIEDYPAFIRKMNDYDWMLWELGATLEGINWYNSYKDGEGYSTWRMNSEYPSTDVEAFASTGSRVFSPEYVNKARKNNEEPLFVGDIRGAAMKGAEALNNVEFYKDPAGKLRIWSMPDHDEIVKDRYASFVDIGGRSDGADYSVIKVIDRYWMMDGGKPEVVAVWRGHIDQDLLAWKAAQLSMMYNNALCAVESNSLEKIKSEGDHFLTILNEIGDHYENLFRRPTPEKIRYSVPTQYGFHTNKSTKPMIINTLNAALRDEGYIERDSQACDEMDSYEIKQDGSYGAVEGAHDDSVIATAGVVWLALDYMDLPKVMSGEKTKRKKKKVISEATF